MNGLVRDGLGVCHFVVLGAVSSGVSMTVPVTVGMGVEPTGDVEMELFSSRVWASAHTVGLWVGIVYA